MKKFYTLFAIAAMAFSANAQLYVVGDGEGLEWAAENPKVVDAQGGKYTFTVNNCSSMKISTATGAGAEDAWAAFNEGAYCCTLTRDNLGTPQELVPSDGNIVMPWKGDYTFVIPTDMSTLTATTTTPEPAELEIYLRGGMNDWGNDPAVLPEWKFTKSADPEVYTFVCDEAHMIPAGIEFKIADASWGAINYGANGVVIPDEFGMDWLYNANNAFLEADFIGTIEFHVPALPQNPTLVVFLEAASVSNVTVDNAAVKEYFNLQGVRVDNPVNGLFIMRQGNKVSKVYVR